MQGTRVVPPFAEQSIGRTERIDGAHGVVDVAKMRRIVGVQEVYEVLRLRREIVGELFG